MTIARNPDTAGWWRLPQRTVSELISARSSGAQQTCVRIVRLDAPGASRARVRHRHTRLEEVIYVERGEAEMLIGEARIRVQAGDAVAIPPGTWHCTLPLVEEVRLVCFFPDPAPEKDYEEEPVP
ncbi:MAG TPA: cupin domain-containing protein [Candidatus Dormibacteraeota bacterium]|nr:cupin domain-containing protein [Candidatus Dormibacteraeota bacterium]